MLKQMLVSSRRICLRQKRASSRFFSFSSKNSTPGTGIPSIQESFEGIIQYTNRCSDRLETFEKYKKKNIFPPKNLLLKNFLLYLKLNLPTNTIIDVPDFLNGAQFACDFVINTMHSTEFVNYSCGAIKESKAADKLRQVVSPRLFDAFVFAMNQSNQNGNSIELNELEIKSVYLAGVFWDRLPFEDYLIGFDEQEEVEKKRKEMVERLQLVVLVNTKEKMIFRTPEGNEETVLNRNNLWTFESLVTQPEDLDWRIVDLI